MSATHTTPQNLDDLIATELRHIEAIRHDLHAHPELGYQEVRTSEIVKRELKALGIRFVDGLAGGTGVLGYLPSTTDPATAPTIALRADMDALPITETTGRSYSSLHNGVMHACGHDGHTSILLGAARALSQVTDRPNNVLFIFQPAEEGGAGGKRMCEDGVLVGDVLGKPVDFIFGLHCFPFLKVGQMASRPGPFMASADQFHITVTGKGGHAAMPHLGIDPVLAASHIVVALQSIASRNVDALDSVVVTIAEFHAGTAHNVIADSARLDGTMRTLNDATRNKTETRIRQIAESTAEAYGATATVEFVAGYPVTVNNPIATDRFKRTIAETFGEGLRPDVLPVMGAEDFSFYGQHVPACFFWLGLLPEGQDRYPNLHTPGFDFNDEALPVGIKAMCSLALSQG